MVLSLASSESSLATKPGEINNDEVESRYTVRPEHHANREARMGGEDIKREWGCGGKRFFGRDFDGMRAMLWWGVGGLTAFAGWGYSYFGRMQVGSCADAGDVVNRTGGQCRDWGGPDQYLRVMCCDSKEGAQSIFSGQPVLSACVAVVALGVITVGTGGYLCCAPTVGSARREFR